MRDGVLEKQGEQGEQRHAGESQPVEANCERTDAFSEPRSAQSRRASHHAHQQGRSGHRQEQEDPVQLGELPVAPRGEQPRHHHGHHDVRPVGHEARYGDGPRMSDPRYDAGISEVALCEVLGRSNGDHPARPHRDIVTRLFGLLS